jgi:hypothetical protein
MDELDGPESQVKLGAAGGDEVHTNAQPAARWRTMKRHTLIAGGLALLVAGAAAGFAVPHQAKIVRPIRRIVLAASTSPNVQPGAQITVTGAATVQGTPDTVNFTIGVHSTGSTATDALSSNDSSVQSLEHALEGSGVTASEMQTSSLDIYTNTDKDGNVTGFSVDNDLDVTMHQVSDAGSALDAAANAVGNNVNLYGISFSISNTSALLATARGEAMGNARTEADQLAAGAGLKLGPIVKVVDEENAQPSYFYGNEDFGAALSAAAVPLERGTQPISVQVSVVYALEG